MFLFCSQEVKGLNRGLHSAPPHFKPAFEAGRMAER
jgi:hypothetical protein